MTPRTRRLIFGGAAVTALAVLVYAEFTDNGWGPWIITALGALYALALIARLFVRRRRRTPAPDTLGPNPVEQMLGGSVPPTYYEASVDDTSQITSRPEPDPLDLDDPVRIVTRDDSGRRRR